ncbi:hypothetical protein Avbf_14459 [Armadillidium vulgare]|nr:hypothetical protein Avbf_14459 [Armadillidium vulgare]
MNNYYCSDAKWKNKMKREKSGMVESKLVITEAPHNDIWPQGRTYPKNAVAIEIRRIVTPTNQKENKWISLFFLLIAFVFILIRLNFINFNRRFVALISGSVLYFRGRYIPINRKFRGFIILVFMFVLRIFFIVFRLNLKSNRAGILTVIRNRIGDSALLLSVAYFMEIRR